MLDSTVGCLCFAGTFTLITGALGLFLALSFLKDTAVKFGFCLLIVLCAATSFVLCKSVIGDIKKFNVEYKAKLKAALTIPEISLENEIKEFEALGLSKQITNTPPTIPIITNIVWVNGVLIEIIPGTATNIVNVKFDSRILHQ